MGEHADDAVDYFCHGMFDTYDVGLEELQDLEEMHRKLEGHIWTLKDGTEIKVEDMATDHIENARAFLVKRGWASARDMAFMLFGPQPQGDHALDAWGSEFDDMCKQKITPYIDFFDDELKRRASMKECPICITGKPGCPNCGTRR